MRGVKVNINKLGPIENSSIEFSNLMIFSGDSGIGKSYVSSLAHYLYALLSSSNRFSTFFKDQNKSTFLVDAIKNSNERTFLCEFSIQEIEQWVNNDAIAYVQYLIGNTNLDGDISFDFNKSGMVEFHVHQEIFGLANNEEVTYILSCNEEFSFSIGSINPTEDIVIDALATLLTAYLKKVLAEPSNNPFYEVFLMPPSRGALLDIVNLTTLASKSAEKILFRAGMYTEFLQNYEKIFSVTNSKKNDNKSLDKTDVLLRKINKGTIKSTTTDLTYELENGTSIPLSSAASSIKELAPLTLFLSKKNLYNSLSIWFEEPEAHLHPVKQTLMGDLVGYIINQGAHMQITSHSDYFLQRISNLIHLYKLYNSKPALALDLMKKHQIDEDSLVNPEKIKTYYLVQNEKGVTSILDNSVEFGIRLDSFEKAIIMDADLTNDLLNIIL